MRVKTATLVAHFTLLLLCASAFGAEKVRWEGSALNRAILAAQEHWKGIEVSNSASSSSSGYKTYTEIHNVCDDLNSASEASRVACLTPRKPKTVYISNAKISANNITFYYGGAYDSVASNGLQFVALPALQSMISRTTQEHRAPTIRSKERFDQDQCPNGIVDGTLHVITHHTPYNVFHAINDNILPLFSQIVMDAYLHPEFLLKPRHLVIVRPLPQLKIGQLQLKLPLKGKYKRIFRNGFNAFGSGTMESMVEDGNLPPNIKHFAEGIEAVSHFEIFDGDFKKGLENGSECYRRIIWGNGPKLFYHPEMDTLRRYAVDLLREYALAKYKPPVPASHSASITEMSPLRATIFLRDPHDGRAMPGELKIAEFINKNVPGVVAGYCWGHATKNRTDSLMAQIRYAAHADIIIGVHGAALANAVFARPGTLIMELKSKYAYHVPLFAMIANSKGGALANVDVRSYKLARGGSKAIDEPLFDRIGQLLKIWQDVNREKADANSSSSLWRENGIDEIFMVGRFASMDDGNLLGPQNSEVVKLIRQHTAWKHYWGKIGYSYTTKLLSLIN